MATILQLRPARKDVYCSGTQCGELLGQAGPSVLEKKRGKHVWHIEPGWLFVQGILQKTDYDFSVERRLAHETVGNERMPTGAARARECDLPLHIRCPKCHRVQMIVPNVVNQLMRRETPGRR